MERHLHSRRQPPSHSVQQQHTATLEANSSGAVAVAAVGELLCLHGCSPVGKAAGCTQLLAAPRRPLTPYSLQRQHQHAAVRRGGWEPRHRLHHSSASLWVPEAAVELPTTRRLPATLRRPCNDTSHVVPPNRTIPARAGCWRPHATPAVLVVLQLGVSRLQGTQRTTATHRRCNRNREGVAVPVTAAAEC